MTTHPRSHSCLTLALSVALVLSGRAEGSAQSVEVVHAFAPLPREPSGKLLQLADGYFLGTSRRGGAFDKGTIYLLYRQSETTWSTFVMHSFFGPEGKEPVAGVMRASDGNFYGTARDGGAAGGGTVFRMTPAGSVSVLHSFSGPDGLRPEEALIEAPDGSLWSTTIWGGSGFPNTSRGTIFRITKAGSFTTMHAFNRVDGEYPNALVAGPDGFFYGSTQFGGPPAVFESGTIFRIATTGALTTVAAFEHNVSSSDLILGADGNLYGTSSRGAVPPLPTGPDFGFAFRVTLSGVVTALHYFVPEDGFVEPIGGLVQGPEGAFYGGTSIGFINGAQDYRGAAMFRLSPDGQVQKVADLGGPLGREPSGLVLAQDGRLYGTTRKGGVPPLVTGDEGFGSAFAIGLSEPATLLFPFSHPTPLKPTGRLTEGPGGALFGTSCFGGVYNRGTVYKLSGGIVTTLHSFTGLGGGCPLGGLTLGPDGVFYGTTFGGPDEPLGRGTVFRITPTGSHTTLWSAATVSSPGSGTPGAFPASAPTLGPDGQLYVTTASFQSFYGDGGAVLRISSDGTVTAIAVFDPVAGYGYQPFGPLTLASDGSFYGTTSKGAGSGVYRMTLDGTLTGVSTFADPSGCDFCQFLRAGLVQGADGRLYGSVVYDGAAAAGFLFAATTSGAVSVLHEFSFSGTDGFFPYAELVELAPGRFIGMTAGSGNVYDGRFGTIFEVTATGGFSTLHRFSWLDGANPFAGLLRTSTGGLYGTTIGGGLGGGVIFRFVPPASLSTR